MSGQVPGWGNKNNEKSVAGWVEYSQNATLVFMSAYSVYVFLGIITIPLSTRLYQQRYLFWLRRPAIYNVYDKCPYEVIFKPLAE